jgi:hypothetical protein
VNPASSERSLRLILLIVLALNDPTAPESQT